MQRNTLLLVSSLAVVAAFLVGVQIGRTLPNTNAQPQAVATPIPTPTSKIAYRTYTDSVCDLSVEYPNSLEVLESTNSGTILANPDNENDTIMIACQQDIPRVPLPPDKITSMILQTATGAAVSAKMYHDKSQKDGSSIDKLIFTHPTSKQDVFIAGYGLIFQQVVASLKLQ